jgi:hypothetical protein
VSAAANLTVVYAGPSINRAEVQQLLPGCTQLGPIRRGELYRDRMLGYSAFVIIDGVFFQDRAVSPRELLDVLQDGAWIAGAASMGALRAAECWPAGMVGVGAIFRLFRRGSLKSDDEVAVAFDPGGAEGATTVALVNVRYALRRALHARRLASDDARRILDAARATRYSDRTWPHILGRAGFGPSAIALVEGHDLKHLDAQRVLRHVARLQQQAPEAFSRPRPAGKHFVPSEMHREASPDPWLGRPEREAREALLGWLRVSGRVRRYLAPPPEPPALAMLETGDVSHESWSDRVWTTLAAQDQQDAELHRHHALLTAVAWARDRGLEIDDENRRRAASEIATEHGVASFSELQAALAPFPNFRAEIDRYRDQLGLAKRVRAAWFDPATPAHALRQPSGMQAARLRRS